ncbi:MAG: PDZ domain-containing protein [Betaproteobacteria bacterium]|nr:MAG: PDZ domain-containing protein [Betaproteobacteria bacterium]
MNPVTLRTAWLVFAQLCAATAIILAALAALDRLWPGILPNTNPAVATAPASVSAHAPHSGYAAAAALASPAVVSIYVSHNGDTPTQGSGLGSGVILSTSGYILTSHHVIETAQSVRVALADGRSFKAQIIGSDPDTDLAVLRIHANNLPALIFAPENSLKVGDFVLAIGNPFNMGQTVTLGIVSALQRKRLGLATYEAFIQTDAAINPGNSGGALIDTQGHLVGINSAIYSRTGGNQGIGFAIPAAMAQHVMSAIITQGGVTRGWIGVEIADLTPEMAETLGSTTGVVISGLLAGSPAERAGVLVGDIVLAIDQHPVKNAEQLMSQVSALTPGRPASLQVLRQKERLLIHLRVGKRPQRAPADEPAPPP